MINLIDEHLCASNSENKTIKINMRYTLIEQFKLLQRQDCVAPLYSRGHLSGMFEPMPSFMTGISETDKAVIHRPQMFPVSFINAEMLL